MKVRHSSQAEQRRLDTALDRGHRLRATDGHPLPIREGQHRMAQQVPQWRAGDGDVQLIAPGEVGLHCFTGSMHLSEEDLLVRACGRTPLTNAPLQRSQLAGLVFLRLALEQQLEQRLRFQLRRLSQLGRDRWPVLLERVLPRTPRAQLLELRWKLPKVSVLGSSLRVHAGAGGREAQLAVLAQLLHQLPHLCVRRCHPNPPGLGSFLLRRHSRSGKVIVVGREKRLSPSRRRENFGSDAVLQLLWIRSDGDIGCHRWLRRARHALRLGDHRQQGQSDRAPVGGSVGRRFRRGAHRRVGNRRERGQQLALHRQVRARPGEEHPALGPARTRRRMDQQGDPDLRLRRSRLATSFQRLVLHWSTKWNPNFKEYVEVKETTNDAPGRAVASQRMYEALEKDKYGIGWGALMHVKGTCVNPDASKCPGYPGLKVIALSRTADGPAIPLTSDNVANRSYPLLRDAYVYVNKPPGRALDPKVREFLRFVLSREGQQIIAKNGPYSPLTPEYVRAQLKKLD